MKRLEDQTLALAGIFQAAALVDQLASKGELNQAAFDCSIDSLFSFEAPNTMEVFGDLSGLSRGLRMLVDYLDGGLQPPSKYITYYVLSMLKLGARLMRDSNRATQVLEKLRAIDEQAGEFEFSRHSAISKIDGLYQATISHLKPRIMVQGEQQHLQNPDTASRIRSLLLAGIRAAILWRQVGGSQWKLLYSRKKYVQSARLLLQKI